ncbi:hypothetical protein ATCC90586_006434 [Pythium insidiosum]|nr:hypothetical protein ATCC90586_006434 [Pythium insidiosum]
MSATCASRDAANASVLSASDAFELATTWAPVLQNCIGLDADVANEVFFEPHEYEWVNVLIGHVGSPRLQDQQAFAARASVIVWRLLAACSGFRVRENAAFWRSVFRSFLKAPPENAAAVKRLRRSGYAYWEARNISDDHKVFPSVSFPRVQLCIGGDGDTIDRVAGVFCGLEYDELASSETRQQLREAVARLDPFTKKETLAATQPIELRLCFDLERTSPERINSLVRRIRNASDAVCAIQALYPTVHSPWQHVSQLELPIVHHAALLRIDWMQARDMGAFVQDILRLRDELRWTLQIDTEHSRCRGPAHVEFLKGFDDEGMPALCSALPHTRCVESLSIVAADEWAHWMNNNDIAWLGYALFHPDTPTSTWRRLALLNITMSESRPMLARMARGQNLLCDVNDPNDLVDFYFTATIRAGAIVNYGLDVHSRKPSTERLKNTTRMDVLVKSCDLSQLPASVTVVVPAFGLARVNREDVIAIEARPPGRPFLTALAIESDFEREDIATIIQHSAKTLRWVSVESDEDLIQWRPSMDAIVAMLSVVSHSRRKDSQQFHAVSRLDRDIVTLIASFLEQELRIPTQEQAIAQRMRASVL